jgi:serine/threonine protein kinase
MADITKLRKLGEGNFGEVWLVYDAAVDRERCIKYIPPSKINDATNFYAEPKTLIDVRHVNIVEVIDAGKDKHDILYIVMEYLSRGSLDQLTSGMPLKPSIACKFLIDVSRGLEYAHSKNYIHRDIKPGNILIGNSDEGKLSDFGLATKIPKGNVGSPNGYLTHLAPEVISKGITNVVTDVYALGVTAYRLLNGDAYLDTPASEEELFDWITTGAYPDRSHYRPFIPSSLRKVINAAMNIDPDKRIQSATAFRHKLEAIKFYCDWGWKRKKNTLIYKTKIGSAHIKCVINKDHKNKFAIETFKTVNSNDWRKINKDSFNGLSTPERRKRIHDILSRYVIEGK